MGRRMLILPEQRSANAYIGHLPSIHHGRTAPFWIDPTLGIFELKQVTAGKGACRSWLVDQKGNHAAPALGGFTVKDSPVFIATPADLGLLLLPALVGAAAPKGEKGRFLTLDDHVESIAENAGQGLARILEHENIRNMAEIGLTQICDVLDVADEKMYRLSQSRLLSHLLAKARLAANAGLPPSFEDHFVARALCTPMLDRSAIVDDAVQLQHVEQLQRLRVVLTYLFSYVPRALRTDLQILAQSSAFGVDFRPLDERLGVLARLRAEALTAQSAANFSQKRNAHEDDEMAIERAEKKRKLEEAEKKKKAEGKGIRNLRKVDTSGMKKMSSFFTQNPKKVQS